jgi:ATP adenylyltransferase
MDRLWAPWRIEYIENPKEEGCFFCKYCKENNDEKHLILHRGENAFIIMNYYPYNNGHLMIAPYKHTGNLSDLDSNTKLEIVDLIQNSIDIIKKSMGADSFNIGVNIGDIAGAGVKDHFHVHIVPRWIGDTNFMPIIGETKVISEGLRQTWEKLHKEFLNITANKL